MKKTSIKLRNMVIYQIFVRNFSESGDFQAIIADLDRIKALGVDMIYLLPIHPIGELQKKGSTEPRKNIEMVMPAVRTPTMGCAHSSGFASLRKTKSEKCMAR